MAEEDDEKRGTPHDRLAKRVLTQPEAAGVELRLVMPARIAERLDFDTIAIEPSAYVDSKLGVQHSDILYSVCIRGSHRRVYIYVLLEHQSTPDPMMPWRVLRYIVRIWDRYAQGRRGFVKELPYVFPIVLAQCENGWTAPYRLSELFDLPDDLRESFGAPVELELTVDELTESVLHDREARDEIVALVELTRALLLACRRAELIDDERIAMLAPLFGMLMRGLGVDDVESLWTYIVSALGPESKFRDMLLAAVDQEQRSMYDAMREAWLKVYEPEWVTRRKQEFRAEGEAKGRAAAKAELLVGLLEQRGLSVPAELRERVLATKDELQLQRWFERAVDAASLDEVFTTER